MKYHFLGFNRTKLYKVYAATEKEAKREFATYMGVMPSAYITVVRKPTESEKTFAQPIN